MSYQKNTPLFFQKSTPKNTRNEEKTPLSDYMTGKRLLTPHVKSYEGLGPLLQRVALSNRSSFQLGGLGRRILRNGA